MTIDYQDPYAAASDPQLPTQEACGQAEVVARFKVFEDDPSRVKADGTHGTQLVDHNPALHKAEARLTEILMRIQSIPEANLSFPIIRRMLRESREWASIVWPSLKGLGINNLRELDGQWVRAELVPTGRTYVRDGETRQLTTFKFVAIYPDEAACRAAYRTAHPDKAEGHATPAPAAEPAAASANQAEAAVALRLIEALIRKVAGDEAALAAQIASMPLLAKYYTAKSPEVVRALDAYLFDQMKTA